MATEWFVEKNGKWHGPFSSTRLKALVASGHLLKKDLVRKGDSGQHFIAGRVKGLFDDSGDSGKTTHESIQKPSLGEEESRNDISEWYYITGIERIGPLTLNELRERLSSGEIHPTTLVWNPNVNAWARASEIECLSQGSSASTPSVRWGFRLATYLMSAGKRFLSTIIVGLTKLVGREVGKTDPSKEQSSSSCQKIDKERRSPIAIWQGVDPVFQNYCIVGILTMVIYCHFRFIFWEQGILGPLSGALVVFLIIEFLKHITPENGSSILYHKKGRQLMTVVTGACFLILCLFFGSPWQEHPKLAAFRKVVYKLRQCPDPLDGEKVQRRYNGELEKIVEAFDRIEFDPVKQRAVAKEIVKLYESSVKPYPYSGYIPMRINGMVLDIAGELHRN